MSHEICQIPIVQSLQYTHIYNTPILPALTEMRREHYDYGADHLAPSLLIANAQVRRQSVTTPLRAEPSGSVRLWLLVFWKSTTRFGRENKSRMVYACFLCNQKALRNDNISLHSFPKDPDLRQRWKKSCGFTEKDDVSRIYICSIHFSVYNLEKVDALRQSRMRLKLGAVPAISVPVTDLTPPTSSHHGQNNMSDCSTEVAMDIGATQSVENYGSCLTETAVNNEENIPPPSELHSSRKQLAESSDTSENASHPTSSEWHTPRKRRFGEPRYIAEISTSDFSTPKRAHRVLKLVKETDENKSKTIKKLHNEVLRLKKRIGSLQDLVQRLTDKGLKAKKGS